MHCNAPEKQTEIRIFRKLFLCIPNLGMIHATRIKTKMHRNASVPDIFRASVYRWIYILIETLLLSPLLMYYDLYSKTTKQHPRISYQK